MNGRMVVATLGELCFKLGGELVLGFSSRKAEALLVYLAVEKKTIHRRESLFTLLWPGMPESSARNNLRQVLFSLRQTIPEVVSCDINRAAVPLLIADRQSVQINPAAAVDLDIHQIDELLADVQVHDHLNLAGCEVCIASLENVVALYRGNFLADFYLEDSSEFEDWAAANREDYRSKALSTLETLAEISIQKGEFEQASSYAEGQIKIDPLREKAYRQLMELYSKSSQRTEALRTYQRCARILDIELGTTPSRETTALYEIISGDDLRGAVAVPQEGNIRGFQIREHLGSGHTGMVYRAFQPVINRDVAIKVIAPQFANHPDFIRRFEVEAQLVARLEHPYIVPLYDYWRDPSGAYLVMRWLKGGSLQADLGPGPWMPEPAVGLIDQISGALSFAHRQGVVHCDIKPANILLDEEGSAYLTDFGIATLTGPWAQLSRMVATSDDGGSSGSLGYISPEVARGQETSPKTDVYSLGVVLFELLTARHPFPGLEGEALIQKHLTEALPSVCKFRTELPAGVDEVIQQATQKDPAQRYQNVDALAQAFRQAIIPESTSLPGISEAKVIDRNPYKGLRPFNEVDSVDFFGRDDLVGRLLAKLSQDDVLPGERFLAVVGPSGSGKSSLVKAGLIPAIRKGAVPGSERWFVVEMTPGAHPMEELETALLRIVIKTPEDLLAQLQADERGLVRVLQKSLPGMGDEVLLVIDQFEELFTLVEEETHRSHFIATLAEAVNDPHSPLRLVLTLRADFYDRPLQYGDFGELVREATEVVLPLSPEELERAICGPSERVGVSIEPALVAQIIQDVGNQTGALPLLQYALTETFEQLDDHQLALEAYEANGGVLGALGRRAEEIYTHLEESKQEITRQLFLRLVTLGEGMGDTRRRVLLSEIESISQHTSEAIRQVIDQYGLYRLLTFDHDPTTRAPTVEVAHEALLREWSRLRSWLDDNRDDIRMQRLLAAAADEWQANGRESSYLLRGTRLEQFSQWAEDVEIALATDERIYLDASMTAHRDRQAAEVERQAHEDALEQRSRSFLRTLVGVFAVATVVAVILSVVAVNQGSIAHENAATATYAQGEALLLAAAEATSAANAREQQSRAEEQSAARATQQALAEAEVSARATAQTEAEIAKKDALRQASIGLAAQARQELKGLSPERAVPLALEALANYPYTWQAERALSQAVLESRIRKLIPSEAIYRHHDLSPDGTKLLSGRENGTVSVYDTSTWDEKFRLTEGEPSAAVWSPDGSKILSISESAYQVWDAAGNLLLDGQFAASLQRCNWHPWAPGGDRFVLSGGDGIARVIDAQSGEILFEFTDHETGEVLSSWSPSGKYIMTTGNDHEEAILWDADTGERLDTFPGSDLGRPLFLAWSPSERYFALGGAGVHIYDLVSKQKVFSHPGFDVRHAAWSPDEQTLVVTDLSGEAWAWDFPSGDLIASITDLIQSWGIAWSPSGDLVAVGGESIRVWDPHNNRELLKLYRISSEPKSIFWIPEGDRIIATGTATSAIAVFDLTSADLTIQGPSGVAGANWSPDGSQISRSYADGTVVIYDADTGGEIMSLDSGTGWVFWSTWSSNGDRILTPNDDNQVKIWDAQTGELKLALAEHSYGWLFSADWSPDGEKIATGDWLNAPMIWDANTGEQILTFDELSEGGGYVAWSPDGTRIVSTSANIGKAMVLDVETGEVLLDLFPDRAVSWVAGAEWSHDGSMIAVFDGNEFGHIFDAQTGKELVQMCCQDSAWQITWSPTDERILSMGADGAGRVWDVETGVELIIYEVGGFPSGEYSPDGTKVLIATGFDGTTRIFPTWHSAQELIDYARECCLVRELTTDEREQFGLPAKP